VFADHVATIDEDLYVSYLHSIIMETINRFKSGADLDWREVELCLHVLYTYGEALPKASMLFVNANEAGVLTPLGELVQSMVTSSKLQFGCCVKSVSFPLTA
jgi:exportin-T